MGSLGLVWVQPTGAITGMKYGLLYHFAYDSLLYYRLYPVAWRVFICDEAWRQDRKILTRYKLVLEAFCLLISLIEYVSHIPHRWLSSVSDLICRNQQSKSSIMINMWINFANYREFCVLYWVSLVGAMETASINFFLKVFEGSRLEFTLLWPIRGPHT